jgi:diadenosine tetraphosphate (Ap4A) HIT family hydrolase
MFKLNNKFLKSSHHLLDLKLCTVRLHDNSKFPWIMLIPKRKNINDITDLNLKIKCFL